jgi:hypothetical protein
MPALVTTSSAKPYEASRQVEYRSAHGECLAARVPASCGLVVASRPEVVVAEPSDVGGAWGRGRGRGEGTVKSEMPAPDLANLGPAHSSPFRMPPPPRTEGGNGNRHMLPSRYYWRSCREPLAPPPIEPGQLGGVV